MLYWTVLLAGLTLAAEPAAQEIPPPQGDAVVAPDARLERLFTRRADIQGGLTEGPAAAPDGAIYFSDIPMKPKGGGVILRFDPHTKATAVFSFNSRMSNGLMFNAQGEMLACEGANGGGRAIAKWNVRTGQRTVLADRFQGKRFNSPNDLCLDEKGRIYFSDPRYVGEEPMELERQTVYRIDVDGTVREVTREVTKPNGLAISRDGKTLFVANTDPGTSNLAAGAPAKKGPMRVYAFDLQDDGTAVNRRTIIDFGDQTGCDGMTQDQDGRLYLTVRSLKRPGVMVITPEGREAAFIPTGPPDQAEGQAPEGLPSNVVFGAGDESHMLYVTIDLSLYRIPLKTRGWHGQYSR